MSVVKLALCLIVKSSDDEADHLRTCLANVSQHVDGIFININAPKGAKKSQHTLRVAKAFANNVIETVWHDNFAEARNLNFAQVPEDYTHIVWLDTDDTIDHPEKLKKVAAASDLSSIYADYLYETDEEGNPLTVHAVARLVKNDGSHVWKGRIHETLVETRSTGQGATKDFTVIHHADEERRGRSFERNIKLLEAQLNDEAETPDPRTFYYLGCTYIDAGQTENAKQLLTEYLNLSGWDQERAAAHTKLGRLYLEENNHFKAKEHFMQAIGEDPNYPEPRIEMGSLELELKQYHKARKWLEGIEEIEKSMTTLERNPMSYTFRTYLLLADTYLSLGGPYLEKALEYAKRAQKFKKRDKNIKQYVKVIESVVEEKNLLKSTLTVVKALRKNKEFEKVKSLVSSVPKQLEDNPAIVAIQNEDSFTWPEKSIVIMCGDSAIDAWGPWSLEEGIGGSEEAIIRISKHLTTLGYRVVVYAKPFERSGLHDGVMWRNFWEANLDDNFDIFIAWRSPYIFDRKIKARKNYLWLHDVVEPGEFTETRLNNLDKVIVLSDYHRNLFPMVPDEKILMSGNGIDPEQFTELDGKVKRDPHKVFYGSSHVRGLAYLYDIWPEVKKAVPDATLDVFYGRESYDAINAGNPERMKWMDDMQLKAKELPGVTDHGKVSQDDIVRHAFESGVWAYPCPFPEVYCITAVKCQAAGAVPVVSNTAALEQMVQYGDKMTFDPESAADLETYKNKLLWWLQHPEEQEKIRPKMMKWARTLSWLETAKGWDNEFQS